MEKYEKSVENTEITSELTDAAKYLFKYKPVKEYLIKAFNIEYNTYLDRIKNNHDTLTQIKVLEKVQKLTGFRYSDMVISTNVPNGTETPNQ